VNKKALFFGSFALLMAAFAGASFMFTTARSGGPPPGAAMAALDRPHAVSLGEANAPVVIAEFLDPACETCAVFYPAVKDLMATNPGQIRLVLRWAPFHQGSPDVVALLEAARLQGQFWPALERLLATQPQWAINHVADVNRAWQQLGGLNLDPDQIRADMAGPEVQGIMQQDMVDATALNVQATPEYFVNGRPMPSFGWEQLLGLVNEELAKAR
jgi:protein-disulfide isomerase